MANDADDRNPMPVKLFEFRTLSGIPVYVPSDTWTETLDNLGFPLDGDGAIALLPMTEMGLHEMVVLFAPPSNAHVMLSEPMRVELAFARGDDTLLMALGIPSRTPAGESLLFTALDLGKAGNREALSIFAGAERVHVIVLDPKTGAILGDIRLRATDMLAHLQMVLDDSEDVRELDLTEGVLAYAQLFELFFGRPQ